jgi:hypothetical protein
MLTEKLQQQAITIINHFGVESQYEKMYEEIQELSEIENHEQEIDEMADCFFILLQHYLINPEMQKRVDFKAQRTLDRIKTDYYNRQLSEVK